MTEATGGNTIFTQRGELTQSHRHLSLLAIRPTSVFHIHSGYSEKKFAFIDVNSTKEHAINHVCVYVENYTINTKIRLFIRQSFYHYKMFILNTISSINFRKANKIQRSNHNLN